MTEFHLPESPGHHFTYPVRVYWEDTDAGGIVFYANYLKFFERARTEWLRALGFEQQRLVDETGVMFVVTDAQLSYQRPARLDDKLSISVELQEVTRTSMRIAQQARLNETLLCGGEIRIACLDKARMRPARIPTPLLDALRP